MTGSTSTTPEAKPRAWSSALRPHLYAIGTIALCAIAYVAVITFGTFDFWAPEDVGVFYDYQAHGLLHGRLDVPDAAIRDEAFEVNGKLYGYFGPTPALLRLPLIALGAPFGHLSKLYMLLEYVAALAAAYLILRDATKWLRGDAAEPSAWSAVILLAGAGLGSTLFFLGSRPMMYHEAIECGAAFALWACWCTLRHLRQPAGSWWLGGLVCGILSLQARPTTGFFALTLLGVTAAWHLVRREPNRFKPLFIGLAAVFGALTLNGVAYLKFKTFDSAPYQYSRPYTYQPGRYDRVGRRKFHAANIPWGFYSYFVRPNLRFEPTFPYLITGSTEPPRAFPNARIDLPDWTVPAPYAMPGLLFLATIGGAIAFALHRSARRPLAVLWIGAAPMLLLLFAFIAIAQRYSGDFCPLLIASSAFGIAAFDHRSGWPWRVLRSGGATFTVAGILVTFAIVFDYQARWGPAMADTVHQRYHHAAERIDAIVHSLLP